MAHRRRTDRGIRGALMASLLLHAAIVTFAVIAEGSPPTPPKTKVYAVDIVSPPPNVAGEPLAEPPATQEPGPAAAAQPQPAAPAAPEPTPPAPEPDPAPPKEEAPREPAKAPEPRRAPEQPKQRPATQPERPAQRPSTTQPNRPSTTTNRPQNQTSANRPAGSSTQSGTGSGANRTQGTGTRTGPATGRNPDASSPGGEGLNIHVEGDPCPVAGYCENVTRQVNRFFRPPPGSDTATGEVCFRIQRDGRVSDIEAQRVRGGGAAFRLAMMEAAEAAGSRRAFGTLPAAFDPARWRWCVELSPRS